jgi:hypothetical protein
MSQIPASEVSSLQSLAFAESAQFAKGFLTTGRYPFMPFGESIAGIDGCRHSLLIRSRRRGCRQLDL